MILSTGILLVTAFAFLLTGEYMGGLSLIGLVLFLNFFGVASYFSNDITLEYLKIGSTRNYQTLDLECSKALDLLSGLPIPKASHEALILHYLSVSKFDQGDFEASVDAMQKSLSKSKSLGNKFPLVALRKYSLAGLLIKLNRFDEAEELIADCFTIMDTEKIKEVHLKAALYSQLSRAEFLKKQFDKSHDHIRKALELKLKCGEHPRWLQPQSWYHIKFTIASQAAQVAYQTDQKHLIPDIAEELFSLIGNLPKHFTPSIAIELSEIAFMLAEIGEKGMSDYFLNLLEEARTISPEHPNVIQAIESVQNLICSEGEVLKIPKDSINEERA